MGPSPVEGMGAVHMAVNRGKKSVPVDLSKPEAKELIMRLAKGADVVVEDYKPGEVEKKLGLSPKAVRATNPSVLYCTISGYGTTGPSAMEKSDEILLQARTGV